MESNVETQGFVDMFNSFGCFWSLSNEDLEMLAELLIFNHGMISCPLIP